MVTECQLTPYINCIIIETVTFNTYVLRSIHVRKVSIYIVMLYARQATVKRDLSKARVMNENRTRSVAECSGLALINAWSDIQYTKHNHTYLCKLSFSELDVSFILFIYFYIAYYLSAAWWRAVWPNFERTNFERTTLKEQTYKKRKVEHFK